MLISEREAKYRRIKELETLGFNTPRMLYIPPYGVYDPRVRRQLERFLQRWKHTGMFNVRTYLYKEGKELLNTMHYTELQPNKVWDVLMEAQELECMVDCETGPRDGLTAGTILVNWDKRHFICDYCHKPGAMVRQADKTCQGPLDGPQRALDPLEAAGDHILRALEAIKELWPPRRQTGEVYYEFSYHRTPAGIKQEPLIFWEYRRLYHYRPVSSWQ